MADNIILIPLADGHVLSSDVIKAVIKQSLVCDIVTISRPLDQDDKRKSEGEVRKMLVDIALDMSDHPFFIMMDRSVVLKSDHILKRLAESVVSLSDKIVHVKCKDRYVPDSHMDVELFAWPRSLTRIVQDAFGFGRYIKKTCWCSTLEYVCSSHGIKQVWLDHDNL